MRQTPLILIALLVASAAQAQGVGNCRGETIAELNDCLAARAPAAPVPEPAPAPNVAGEDALPGQAETQRPTTFQPQAPARATMGGALQPRNLRASPSATSLRSVTPGTRNAGAPAATGMARDVPAAPVRTPGQRPAPAGGALSTYGERPPDR